MGSQLPQHVQLQQHRHDSLRDLANYVSIRIGGLEPGRPSSGMRPLMPLYTAVLQEFLSCEAYERSQVMPKE